MSEKDYRYGEPKNYEVIRFLASLTSAMVTINTLMEKYSVTYYVAQDRLESLTRLKLLTYTVAGRGASHSCQWAITEKGRAYEYGA